MSILEEKIFKNPFALKLPVQLLQAVRAVDIFLKVIFKCTRGEIDHVKVHVNTKPICIDFESERDNPTFAILIPSKTFASDGI